MATADRTPAGNNPTDIASAAALLADPSRARILLALADGRALPASRLASEAGVSPSTTSTHLAKLTAAGLLSVESNSPYRYYRLGGAGGGPLHRGAAAGRAGRAGPLSASRRRRPGDARGAHLLRPPRRTRRGRDDGRDAEARIPQRRRRQLRPGWSRGGRPDRLRP